MHSRVLILIVALDIILIYIINNINKPFTIVVGFKYLYVIIGGGVIC